MKIKLIYSFRFQMALLNLSTLTLDQLMDLLKNVDKEVACRTPRHPVSLLHEWQNGCRNKSVNYCFQKIKNETNWGWMCDVILIYGDQYEKFTDICMWEEQSTKKRELWKKVKKAVSIKALEESKLYKVIENEEL